MMLVFKKYIVAFLVLFCTTAFAQTTHYSSGEKKVSLMELYTSEGCSSCPPADRWLGRLRQNPLLWKQYVPLAFHVDYWNYLGWRDVFSNKKYSQRQRKYARQQKENTVFTPAIRVQGQLWYHWRKHENPPELPITDVGDLQIDIDNKQFSATFSTQNAGTKAQVLNVAILGMGFEQNISRGENKGKKLPHNFVVLSWEKFAQNEKGIWQGNLPAVKHQTKQYAIAVWVNSKKSLMPIQALGGWLNTKHIVLL